MTTTNSHKHSNQKISQATQQALADQSTALVWHRCVQNFSDFSVVMCRSTVMLVQHFSFSSCEDRHNFFSENGTISLSVHRFSWHINGHHTIKTDACPYCQACRLAWIANAFHCVFMSPVRNIMFIDFTNKVEDTLVRKRNFSEESWVSCELWHHLFAKLSSSVTVAITDELQMKGLVRMQFVVLQNATHRRLRDVYFIR